MHREVTESIAGYQRNQINSARIDYESWNAAERFSLLPASFLCDSFAVLNPFIYHGNFLKNIYIMEIVLDYMVLKEITVDYFKSLFMSDRKLSSNSIGKSLHHGWHNSA
jgi:hypothetical protein